MMNITGLNGRICWNFRMCPLAELTGFSYKKLYGHFAGTEKTGRNNEVPPYFVWPVRKNFVTHFQIVRLLFFLDPVQRLLLWINTQWIPAGLCGENTILDRQFIRGEPLRRPSTDLHIVSKECVQLEGLTHRDFPVEDVLLPLPSEHVPPEVPSKGPKIAKEGRGHEAVTQQTDPLSFQLFKIFGPSG